MERWSKMGPMDLFDLWDILSVRFQWIFPGHGIIDITSSSSEPDTKEVFTDQHTDTFIFALEARFGAPSPMVLRFTI